MTDHKSQGGAKKPAETDDYSASQAPETQQEAQGKSTADPRLIPGGAHGSEAELGLTGMDESEVPSKAHKPAQLDVRDSPDDRRR